MRKLLTAIILAIAPLCAYAQGFTTITANSCIGLGDGSTLAAGTFQVQATDNNDGDIPFRAGSAFQSLRQPVMRTVVNGSLSSALQLGTPSLTSPMDILFRITITDNATKKVTVYRKVPISGTTWDFCSMNTGLLLPSIPHVEVGGSGAVDSVNGHAGTVTLGAADVGADVSGAAAAAQTTAIASAVSTSLQKAGGTMTGAIVLPGDPVSALQASTKQYVDAHAGGGSTSPILVGDLATGVIADYAFSTGSGTVLVDSSGNGNNGTFGAGANAPAWVQGGVGFTGQTGQGISLPSALNAGKTFVIAAYWTPNMTSPCGVNWAGPSACPGSTVFNVNGFPAWITSSTGSGGISFITGIDGESFGQPMTWNSSQVTRSQAGFSGFHVIVWVLGTGGGDLDHIYVDGAEVSYGSQGSTAGAQTSGNLFIGSSGVGPWTASSPQAVFYRVRVHSTQYTAADAAAITQVFLSDVASRGIATTPLSPLQGTPQLHCIGDSITAGTTLVTSAPYCSILNLTNQPTYTISNWGAPSQKLQQFSASEPNRVSPLCQSVTGGPGVAHILAGVNDFSAGVTAPQVYALLQGEVQSLKRGGCKVFVATLLDFTGGDAQKNAYNDLIRTGIVASGADGIDDMAADPLLGADGAAANATIFNGGLHPTDVGEPHLAAAMSATLNYYFGSTAGNPTRVTAATYSMLSGDAYVITQPTANQTITLPNCIGPTGGVYALTNSQAAFTVGIKNLIAAETINGIDHSSSALAVPSNSTMKFRIVALPSSTGGCVWTSF
jgi:trimeric autotransporter adhesin